MPRRRDHTSALSIDQARDLRFALSIGCGDWELRRIAATDRGAFDVLGAAWSVVGGELTAEFQRTQPGSRRGAGGNSMPQEERPSCSADGALAELVRLVELGELDGDEVEAIFARADSKLGGHEEITRSQLRYRDVRS